MIRNIFLYLDRTYVLQTPKLKSIWDMGLTLFRETILGDQEILKKTISAVLQQVNLERFYFKKLTSRDGNIVSKSLIGSITKMFIDLSIYLSSFETPYLETTRTYFIQQSDSLVRAFDSRKNEKGDVVSEYLLYVTNVLELENQKCTGGYLDPLTRKTLANVLQNVLIERHCDKVIEFGLEDLLDKDKSKDLKRLYELLLKINKLDKLKVSFSNYIQA